jgi:hypothetical protein
LCVVAVVVVSPQIVGAYAPIGGREKCCASSGPRVVKKGMRIHERIHGKATINVQRCVRRQLDQDLSRLALDEVE